MSHRYDRTGERITDDRPLDRREGADLCRQALEVANAARRCPVCHGQLKPGWTVHPSCRTASNQKD
jgi:hypothetical protein